MTWIRFTHPHGFRCGEWAEIKAELELPCENILGVDGSMQSWDRRACYLVEFPDGVTDFWPTDDPAEPYEFASSPPARGIEG